MTWQPIETAPRDGTRVRVMGTIVRGGGFDMFVRAAAWLDGEWEARDGIVYPTHWQPLPSADLDAPSEETIVAVAIQTPSCVASLPKPARHSNILHAMMLAKCPKDHGEQGFLTNTGRFVNRREAMEIARKANQVIPRAQGYLQGQINTGDTLFSEDLW